MSVLSLIIILLAGVAAGFVNAVSAAGSLITLPAFIFAGLTSAEANATNRVAILLQNLFSSYGFKSKGLKTEPLMWWLAAATVPGAVIGAWFALKIPDAIFNKILAVVMIVFLVITLTNPLKAAKTTIVNIDAKRKAWGMLLYFFIGIYGGFIQAGSGFFLMAGCLLLFRFDIVKTNYYKSIIMLVYTMAAFLVFYFKGNINWFYGLLMGVGTAIGGYIGSRWSVTADEVWIKRMIIGFIVLMSIYLWVFK